MTRRGLSLTSLLTLAACGALMSACVDPREDFGEEEEGIGISDETGISEEDEGGFEDSTSEEESGGEEGDQGMPTCETTTATVNNIPPNVVLVLDKSRSMVVNAWDDDGNPDTEDVTRWHSLHDTVDTVGHQYQDGMSLGLTLFPSVDAESSFDGACPVNEVPEVGVGLGNAEALLAAIPAADDTDLHGATPAAAGIATALAHLEALEDGRPAAMILVTDGAANCSAGANDITKFSQYDEDLPLVVADAWDRAGIPTYVVGIDIQESSEHPFTNPREKLHEVAEAGGVARSDGEVGFYDAGDAQALTAALDEIAASVSCGIELGKAPVSEDELYIAIDGEYLPRLDSCDEGDGWIYTSEDLTQIELCNASCDLLLAEGEVTAEFACPPQP
ncbi:hypothetical protein PPSIR1_24789 [Plesiocystis pacifica SIR-1]|uniref:VWFA domain-containing protein n=1 Tax=Plesiocystis pacifica SIR-1 TaxID=391625 RepID=A6G9F2_9BACT|nr:VWA domain-containing protein [Plesiocystis pacifica]EDM77460.1 hypothetical protein PPSIR1_24789 [Plesiocystis pacifica SIR-1]